MNVASDQRPATSSLTSLSLLERAKARDTDAWTKLLALYGPEVYASARRAGLGREDVNDLAQEVFLAVANHLDDFRRDHPGDTFRGWLRAITRNKIRDHFRLAGAEPPAAGGSAALEGLGSVPSPGAPESDDGDDTAADGQLLRRALELIRAEFKPNVWQAFWSVAVEGRSPAEVAAGLGLTRDAVYKSHGRVLKRLRAEFKDLIECRPTYWEA